MSKITMYTDGSSLGNPGPGGFGIVLMSGPYRKELSADFRLTTNDRVELMTVIVGLETLENNGSERSMPRSAYCRDVSIRRCRAKRCRERGSRLYLEHDFFGLTKKLVIFAPPKKRRISSSAGRAQHF